MLNHERILQMYCHNYYDHNFQAVYQATLDLRFDSSISPKKKQRINKIKNKIIDEEIAAHLRTKQQVANPLGRFFHGLIQQKIINAVEIKQHRLNYNTDGTMQFTQPMILDQNKSQYVNQQQYYTILIELNAKQKQIWPQYQTIVKQQLQNYYQMPMQETTIELDNDLLLKVYSITASVIPYVCTIKIENTELIRRTLKSPDLYAVNIINNVAYQPTPHVHPQVIANMLDMFNQNNAENAQKLNQTIADVLPAKNIILNKTREDKQHFKKYNLDNNDIYPSLEYSEDYHHQKNLVKSYGYNYTDYFDIDIYIFNFSKLLPQNEFSKDNPKYSTVNQAILKHFDLD